MSVLTANAEPTAEDRRVIVEFQQQFSSLVMSGRIDLLMSESIALSQRLTPAGQQLLATTFGAGPGLGNIMNDFVATQQLNQARAELNKAQMLGMASSAGIRPPF